MNKRFTIDADLTLKDAGAVVATGAGYVDGAAKILDVGAARMDARAVVDVSAINVSATANKYVLVIEGSNSSAFANIGAILGSITLGHQTATGFAAASTVGRNEIHFTNEQDGVVYRYIRVRHIIAGSPVSINYTANVAKQ